jgi:hypothetical protein
MGKYKLTNGYKVKTPNDNFDIARRINLENTVKRFLLMR